MIPLRNFISANKKTFGIAAATLFVAVFFAAGYFYLDQLEQKKISSVELNTSEASFTPPLCNETPREITINSISPSAAAKGSSVTITGTDLSNVVQICGPGSTDRWTITGTGTAGSVRFAVPTDSSLTPGEYYLRSRRGSPLQHSNLKAFTVTGDPNTVRIISKDTAGGLIVACVNLLRGGVKVFDNECSSDKTFSNQPPGSYDFQIIPPDASSAYAYPPSVAPVVPQALSAGGAITWNMTWALKTATPPPAGTLTIDKTVRNATSGQSAFINSIGANPNDSDPVEFKVVVACNGGVCSNVTFTDQLPTKLAYVQGSFKIDGAPAGNSLTNVSLGNFTSGQSKTVLLQANLAAASQFSVGATPLTNTGTVGNQSDTAIVTVNRAPPTPTPTPSPSPSPTPAPTPSPSPTPTPAPSLSPTPTPSITTFTATPSFVAPGQSTVLYWSVSNATSVNISPNIGAVTPVTSGTKTVIVNQATTYTMTALGPGGSATPRSVAVTVGQTTPSPTPTPPPTISSFTATPTSIASGQSTVLYWSTSNATSVSISPNIGSVTPVSSGTKEISLTQTTTFTMTAIGSNGSASPKSVTVTVPQPNLPPPSPAPTPSPSPTPTPSSAIVYPDGILLLDSGTVYFIEYGLKRPFASMQVLNGFGYKLTNVITASSSAHAGGSSLLISNQRHPRASLVNDSGTIYFLGRDYRYAFPSAEVFFSWGHDFARVVPANSFDKAMPKGPAIQTKP